MRHLILTIPLIAAGCVFPGTDHKLKYDPTTGAIESTLDRDWLAGPVDMTADFTAPNGAHGSITWKSDVNLDPALAAQQANMQTISQLSALVAGLVQQSLAAAAQTPPPAAPAVAPVVPGPEPESAAPAEPDAATEATNEQ